MTLRSFAQAGLLVLALLSACRASTPPKEADDVRKLETYVFKHEGIIREVGIFTL